MAVDVSTIAFAIDSTQAVKAKADLDQLGPSMAAVEKGTDSVAASSARMNAGFTAAANSSVRSRAEMSDSATKYIAALQKEIDVFGRSRSEIEKIEAASLKFTKAESDKVAAMGAAIDALHREEAASKAAAAQQDQLTASQDAYMAKLREKVAMQSLDATGMEKHRAAQLGLTSEAGALIGQLETGAAKLAAHKTETMAAAGAMEHFGFQTAQSKRELLVLAHELSQGNFKKFGGSMMVLGEQTGAASLLFTGMGLAVIGVTAVLGGLAVAAIMGHIEQEKFNKSLVLTGNFAGQTNDSIQTLTATLSQATHATTGTARGVVEALAATGEVGPRMMEPMAEAILRIQRLNGESTEKMVKDYAKLAESPTKWALEHNKAANDINVVQYEQIRRLEELGLKEEAALLVIKAVTDHVSGPHAMAFGTLEKMLHGTAEGFSSFVDWMKSIGRETTMQDRLRAINTELQGIQDKRDMAAYAPNRNPMGGGARADTESSDNETRLSQAREILLREQAGKARQAYYAAESGEIQKQAIHASAALKALDDRARGVDKLKLALENLAHQEAAEVAGQRDAGNKDFTIDKAAHAKRVAELERENRPRGPVDRSQDKLETTYTSSMNTSGAEGARLDAEIIQWEKYGKSVDKSRLAVAEFDIAQGKLKGKNGAALTEPQKAAYLASEASNDTKEQTLNLDKAAAAYEKHTRAVAAATEAGAMNARQMAIAADMQRLEETGIVKGTARYERLAAARTAALNGEFDTKGAAEAEKRSKAIAAMADAQELNARQTKIAVELEQLESGNLVKGTALYTEAAKVRTAAVNAEFDAKLKLKLAAQQLTNDDEVHKIDAETAALGLGTLAKINAANASKLYAQAQIEIAANPGMTAQILDAMVTKTNQLADAELRRYTAKRGFDTGADAAFQKYQESAGDAAGFAEKIITGSFSRMEDALVNFTKTGKLNFGSLFQFMADEFIRQQVRMQIAAATSGTSGSGWLGQIGSAVGKYFGASDSLTVDTGGASTNYIGDAVPTRGGRSSGGSVNEGQAYLVGEKGPEELRMGAQGGSITPNEAIGGSSKAVTVIVNNNGSPVSAKSTQRETSEGTIIELMLEAVAADMSGGGKVHDATQRRFGLNPGGTTPRY